MTAAKVEVDWLLSEISDSIQAYIEDNARLTELKHAADLLKKTANSLQIIQIHGGVILANETIKVIQDLVDGNAHRLQESQYLVSCAIIRLDQYLQQVKAVHQDVPIVLMPLLNDLRASRNAALLSENVLFSPNIDAVQAPAISGQKSADMEAAWLESIRGNFKKHLFACIDGKDAAAAAAQLYKLCVRLQRASQHEPVRKLWWLSGALLQAVAMKALPLNAGVASLLNSLDKQISVLIDIGEARVADSIDENTIKDILYYIAIARERGAVVKQVKQAYALDQQVLQQQDGAQQYAHISAPSDQVFITASKALLEELATGKDCIELFIHGNLKDVKHIEKLRDILQKISDILLMIGIDQYEDKIARQIDQIELICSQQQADVELSLLEISKVVLEVETGINNFIEYRINFHSADENSGQEPSASQSLSEYQAAYSVTVSQVLLDLEQLKEALTEIIHTNFDDHKCAFAVKHGREIGAVISMIDLDSPGRLLNAMTDYISSQQFKRNVFERSHQLEDLADCMVALQCYFEQLRARADHADQIIEYCQPALDRLLQASTDSHEKKNG